MRKSLVCVDCHSQLTNEQATLVCNGCGASYPILEGIADFSRGKYFDSFDAERDRLSMEHLQGLELEIDGSIRRIRDFYAPLIRGVLPTAVRVLDAGCGNGVSVDVLRSEGFDAWGNDVSQLRKHQWRDRRSQDSLVVASALELPFCDDHFDVVISSGVMEHIGVAETPSPRYSVKPLANQRELRVKYLRELGRVVRPGGRIFLDFPNGRFPIDFWHGNSPGSLRPHSFSEQFLPTFSEVRQLAALALESASVRARSPRNRLQFRQSGAHWHGRLFNLPAALLFKLMERSGFHWLASSAINPFLVVEIEC